MDLERFKMEHAEFVRKINNLRHQNLEESKVSDELDRVVAHVDKPPEIKSPQTGSTTDSLRALVRNAVAHRILTAVKPQQTSNTPELLTPHFEFERENVE